MEPYTLDTPELRKARGAFFTPPEIAAFLAQWALAGNPNARVLDPTCGESVFLLAAAEELLRNGAKPELRGRAVRDVPLEIGGAIPLIEEEPAVFGHKNRSHEGLVVGEGGDDLLHPRCGIGRRALGKCGERNGWCIAEDLGDHRRTRLLSSRWPPQILSKKTRARCHHLQPKPARTAFLGVAGVVGKSAPRSPALSCAGR